MGLFWNWNKHKAAPPASQQQEPQKEKPTQHTVPPGDSKWQPHQPEQHSQPLHQQETAPTDDAKPHVETDEMRKFVFRLSSRDPAKCDVFVKEMLRKVNRHDWHNLSGRVGKHIDGIKMRIDIKGKHDDIQSFIQWCKTDHHGVHAYEVIESKLHRMPYSGTPPFRVQQSSWPTS